MHSGFPACRKTSGSGFTMISDASQRVLELNDSTQLDISECVRATTEDNDGDAS